MTLLFRKLNLLLVTFLCVLLMSCGDGGGSTSTSVTPTAPSSTAVYTVTGTAPAGATLYVAGIENKTATSDVNGFFSIGGLPSGEYIVRARQEGFIFTPFESKVVINGASAVTQTFKKELPNEGLSTEDLQRLDSVPPIVQSESELVLPNGQLLYDYLKANGISVRLPPPTITSVTPTTILKADVLKAELHAVVAAAGPQATKNLIIATMVATARLYAEPVTFAADPTDVINRPAQTKYSYVWNGKTPDVRTLPGDGCPQRTFGMDCSGLVSKIAAAAGIDAPSGTPSQLNVNNWKLPEEFKLKVEAVTDGKVELGDIVGWAGHDGIATGPDHFISSTGGPGQCTRNIDSKHGPRLYSFSAFGKGRPTTILRITVPLSGDFTTYTKCTGNSTDAATIKFKVDNAKGGPFTTNGTGIDYDGTPLSFVLNGDYDPLSNILSANLSLRDGTRRDSFKQKLLNDDTGYIPMSKVVDNGGCAASIRIVRDKSS